MNESITAKALNLHNCGVCSSELIKVLKVGLAGSTVQKACATRKHIQDAHCPVPGCTETKPHIHRTGDKERKELREALKVRTRASGEKGSVERRNTEVVTPVMPALNLLPRIPAAPGSRFFGSGFSSGSGSSTARPPETPAAPIAAILKQGLKAAVKAHGHVCGAGCNHGAAPAATQSSKALAGAKLPLGAAVIKLESGQNNPALVPQAEAQGLQSQNPESQEPATEETHHAEDTHSWRGIAPQLESKISNPQLQKVAYLFSSIMAATPFGELFSALSLPETLNKLLGPILGVSFMQGVLHGLDRLQKFAWTVPVVLLSSVASLANVPRLVRRIVTVALLQGVEAMQDPSLHKHGDHYHGDTQLRFKYFLQRLTDKTQLKRLLQNLGRLEVTINTAIPVANQVRAKIEKVLDSQNKLLKRTVAWSSWVLSLVGSIVGLDFVIEKLIKKFNNSEDQNLVSKEAALACGHCGGIHVEVACPVVIAEESALAAAA